MMEFACLVLAITLAILLASFVACAIMLQPKVVRWYTKKTFKFAYEIAEELCKDMTKDL